MLYRFARGQTWSPLKDYPAARVYRSDVGVTSAGSATRYRCGVQCADDGIEGLDPLVLGPFDGQGMVELSSGRLLRAGGSPNGHADPATYPDALTNAIWYSDDRGKTWGVLLAKAAGSSTRPAPAHTFGFFTMTVAGTEYVYWLGGDPFTPTGDVFRSSDGGTTWTRISTSCPTSGLALYLYGVLDGVIYVGAGQTSIQDTGVANKEWWKSTDYGVTWTSMGTIVPANVYGDQLGPLPVKDGKLWIAGSGRYHSTVNDFSNAVVTFDGTTFSTVLADGHAQFPKSRYHSLVVDSAGTLWRFNGTTWDGVTLTSDTSSVYHSDDGLTWTQFTPVSSTATHAQAAVATSDGIYYTDGFQSKKVHVIRRHAGALVSAWADQGSAGLDLAQADDAKKPILHVGALGSRPGIVGTGAQILTLAAPDRDIANGIYEAYVVCKTLNFDTGAAQGPNAPATLVGNQDASTWNNFGLNDGALEYRSAAPSTTTTAGSGIHDDTVHVIGVQHTSESGGTSRLYVDGSLVSTVTGIGFSTSWTGWDSVLGGYLGVDNAAAVIGAVVVIRDHTVPTDDAFRTKLQTWAARWGS